MKNILLLISTLLIFGNAGAQYCPARTQHLYEDHQIRYFQIDTFIHITSDTPLKAYNDYTDSMVIAMGIGGAHFVVLSKGADPDKAISGNTVGFSIWIDFNDDSTFSSDEQILGAYKTGSGDNPGYTYKGKVTFPATATLGRHRLRVRDEWGDAPDSPCDTLWGGETEDYTVEVNPGMAFTSISGATGGGRFSLYPNPSSGQFTIDMPQTYGHVEVTIADYTGRVVEAGMFENSRQLTLGLNGVAGTYFVSINYGAGVKIMRLVKR